MNNSRIYDTAEQALASANASLSHTPPKIHYGTQRVSPHRITISPEAEAEGRQRIKDALRRVLGAK